MMLLYSNNQVKKTIEPLINLHLGQSIQSVHKLKTNQIIKELIPLNKNKDPWDKVFMKHMPYYFIYGMNKRDFVRIEKYELHKLERIVIKIIHRNIEVNVLPLECDGSVKMFEELHIYNYILFYCLLAFSGRWEWLMQEMELIVEKVPGIDKLDWLDLYNKYSQQFRKSWAKHIDV